MKNLYTMKVNNMLKFLVLLIAFLFGNSIESNAQVRKQFTQRSSQYTPAKKIYNVKGDFTMLGNTSLTPQNYTPTTNNNGQFMTYVDTDNDPSTFNSSSSTLVLSNENGANPLCSNIVFAGLYWTGKSSASESFNVTKNVQTGTQNVNTNSNVVHNQNIANTNFSLSITRNSPTSNNRNPIYTFSGNGTTYAFNFLNSGTNRVTLSINNGTAVNIPVTVNGAGTEATLVTPYVITDGGVTLTIKKLYRDASTTATAATYQSSSTADVNVSGLAPIFGNVTKTFNKRQVSLKGPAAASYTQVTASTNNIYYPNGTDDNIFSAYVEITDYVRTNGIGEYFVADMPLLEGNVSGTGYSGGWGMIVIYENSKMKYRDVTIFDGYAYVNSGNTTGLDLPVSGFNTVQSGNVGMKIGVMASEGDVSFVGDYFKIRKLNSANYLDLSHSGNTTTNFFNSSINTGGARNPQLTNNTGIDIAIVELNNPNNTIIGNNQTSTNFKYGTNGDTYSIFAIAMAVDAYVPEAEGLLTATTINNVPAVMPLVTLPGQDVGFSIDVKNLGTEAINNYKVIIPIPYNASYVNGSATGTLFYTNPNTTITGTYVASLGATGSIVWDFGTLPLPSNPSVLLAKLSFKLKATTDCAILNNASCASTIAITGNSSGIGSTTSVPLNNSNLIQGYTQNGNCVGEPVPSPLNIGINGASYVSENCPNSNVVRNFTFCSSNTTVGTSEIASNFPPGSMFYNEFPVNINSIEYSDETPIPLVAGSTVTYFAVPAGGGNGCNFPFTISKCPKIIAQDDTLSGGNGANGNPNIGNIFNNNGNGADTLNGTPTNNTQVNVSIITPATSINGNPVPTINTSTGVVSVPPGTPAGTYTITYEICEIGNNSNCDSAIVTITVTAPAILAVEDLISIQCATPGLIGNVISNDLLNNASFTADKVNISLISGGNININFDATSGDISILSGLSVGQYTLKYKICEKINPNNCSIANVVITVVDNVPPIIPTLSDVTGECTVTVSPQKTSDACSDALIIGTTTDPLTYNVPGSYVITWSFSDGTNVVTATQNVTVTIPAAPTNLLCYQVATFNTATCSWEVTGEQPTAPTVLCYQTATWNPDTCLYDVTGEQPAAPTVLCYQTATWNPDTCLYDVTGEQPAAPTVLCYQTATWNPDTCLYDVTGEQPAAATVLCYQTATWNPETCLYDVTGEQPAAPTVLCYQTATWNPETCLYDVTGEQPAAPTVLCYQTATWNPDTCLYDVTGEQPAAPTVLCYQTATWNPDTCLYDVTGEQPAAPTVLCYQTATWNPDTCLYDVTGEQPAAPTVLCYQTATWNPETCLYDVTGEQPAAPTVLCYQTATWNPDTCLYDVTGEQPAAPTVLCYQTATWNPETCLYDVTGEQPAAPTVLCYQTATWNPDTCLYDVTGEQPAAPTVLCYQTATWNPETCLYDVTGEQPAAPTVLCYQTATWNPDTCLYDVTGEQPAAPTVLCYQTATWNPETCLYDVTGEQPAAPTVLCYQTATWNPETCLYDVTGEQPTEPTGSCFETATWNPVTCQWDLSGDIPVQPTVLCYQTATFNTITCVWDVTGEQPAAPTVLCYQTATWNPDTCLYDVTGEQPAAPTVLCYQTATWNPDTCLYDVTGEQPAAPTVLCYQTATWNPDTCLYDVTGEQPAAPTVLCYQTATWNPDTCLYDVTGEQPAAPTVLCYQTATWNPDTCLYDVTGEQPAAPTVLCYQTATWNPDTCLYDVTGEQPAAPTVLCYQTATWNPDTCLYDVTGEQPAAPTVLCYQTATWNPDTCLYDITGEQPAAPTVLCYQTATWNPETCLYDVTGEQPAAPTVLCYQTATWNPDTCLYDVTGEQPAAPTVLCYQTATWNPDTCLYDVTGEQPAAPTVLCYQTATWNPETCLYDVTGEQPAAPTVLCYQTANWNPETCLYDVTGEQPAAPTVLCYQTATWNPETCLYDVTGEQPAAPTVLCYQTATWNPDTCLYDVTGEQPAAPTVLCYQTATWNPDTCLYDVTGEQPAAPTILCYQTATWNPDTCLYDVTGEQPAAPTVLCYQTATWNPETCLYDVTGEQPAAPTVLCYQTATWNPDTCLYDVTGEQPAAPTVLCYQTATWNPDTCLYDVTGEQPAAPTVLCYQTATWNPDTCLYDVTGEQPAAPTLLCYQIATWNPDTCLYDVTGEEPISQQVSTESCNEAEFDTIDLATLLPAGTPDGGTWTNVDNVAGFNGSVFNGYLIESGTYTFSYIYDGDGPCPERVDVLVNVISDCFVSPCENIIIHNAFSPNGDALNQYFSIENIEDFSCYPTNKVEIYNRWGVLVYETTNYDNNTRRFEGISEGRVTVSKSSELPTGTYFYIIQYSTTEGTTVNKNGYLYLTR